MNSERFITKIPNWLTFLRLLLIPVFVLLLANDPSRQMVYSATVVFVLAAVTDYADGFIARRYRAVSDFGKLLDPLADKILVMAALVMLSSLRSDVYGDPWVPGWMVVLVLAREIWITGLRGLAATQGTVLAASGAGKVKSGLQMVSLVLLLLHDYPLSILGFGFSAERLGLNLLLVSILVSYWGAIEYTQAVLAATGPAEGGQLLLNDTQSNRPTVEGVGEVAAAVSQNDPQSQKSA